MADTKMCPYCGENIKFEAIKCKHCHSMLSKEDDQLVGAAAPARTIKQTSLRTKKPIWKQWWVWAAIIILFIAIVASGGSNDKEPDAKPEALVEVPEELVTEAPKEVTKTTDDIPEATDNATLGERNAAAKALDYLAYSPFSYSGLVEQLKYEGYSNDEAVYGANKSGANWKEQAALKALDYLAYSPFSYSGLVEQLMFEGFTNEEAVYGVDKCGANWNEQAALKAQDYLDYSSFSRDGLIAQLEFEGFTRQQAEYGVQAVGY